MPIIQVFDPYTGAAAGGGPAPCPPCPPAPSPVAPPAPTSESVAAGGTPASKTFGAFTDPDAQIASYSAAITNAVGSTTIASGSGLGPYDVSGFADGNGYTLALTALDASGDPLATALHSVVIATAGGSPPIWLNVPTQFVTIPTTSATDPTVTFTLNTPTNGTGPYTWKIYPTFGWTVQLMLRQFGTGGQSVEMSGVRNIQVESSRNQRGTSWKVVVEDSVGNIGVGFVFVYELDPNSDLIPDEVHEVVLDPAVSQYQFPARTSPPGVTSVGSNSAPFGTGFCYPSNTEPSVGTDHEATQFVVTVPAGDFFAISYLRNYSSNYQRVWLIVRRPLTSSALQAKWGPWEENNDFLDLAGYPSYTAPSPLVATETAQIIAPNSVTGRDYPAIQTATLGLWSQAPTAEVLSVDSGLMTVRSEYGPTTSSRQVWLSLVPLTYQTAQDTTTRMASLSPATGLMVRIKFNLTILGNYAIFDIRVGPSPTSGKIVGVRFNGRRSQLNSLLIDGEEPIYFQTVRGTSPSNVAIIKKPMIDGLDWAVDMYTVGGVTYYYLYPWDPSWTDFPAYREDRLDFVERPAEAIGPSTGLQDTISWSPQGSPWGMSPWPISQTDGSMISSMGNSVIGVHGGINLGTAPTGVFPSQGGTLLIKQVQYKWCSLIVP